MLRLAMVSALVTAGTALCAAPPSKAMIEKARAAERLVAEEKLPDAIAAFEKIEKEFPGQPALNLRLAELCDLQSDTGLALYYYRRYLNLAADRSKTDARERASALELMLDVRAKADAIAKQRKESLPAAPVPTPKLEVSIQAALPNGELKTINSAAEFMKLADPKAVAEMVNAKPSPSPTASSAQDAAVVSAFAARDAKSPSSSIRVSASGVLPNKITVVESASTPKPASSPAAPAIPQASADSAPAADPQSLPPASGAYPWQAPADPNGAAGLVPEPPPVPVRGAGQSGTVDTPLGYQAPSTGMVSQPMVSDPAPLPLTTDPPVAQSAARPLISDSTGPSQGKTVSGGIDPRQRFFVSRPAQDGKLRLRLNNSISESVVSFAAVPEAGGRPVNAIIATGENRAFELKPGAYDIRLTMTSLAYPPVVLMDRKFRMRFNAGTEYVARISEDAMQRLN